MKKRYVTWLFAIFSLVFAIASYTAVDNDLVKTSFLLALYMVSLLLMYAIFSKKGATTHLSDHETQDAEESYRQKAEKLEEEKQMTELFLASMSHEVRTPLNGIVGLTELLDGTTLSPEQREFVTMIRESSNNLRVIVNDILDISKINAGKMELETIPFDFFGKLASSVGIFVPKIEEKGIVLNFFTDPNIPQVLKGDPTRLSQVVINLISNAVKFTPDGGKIDLYAEYVENTDKHVTFKVSVSDSGIGLTEAQQQKIFEAYGQADASTTRIAGGTGLGLTISRKIIEAMGGELQVKSKEGEGATFYFTLTMDFIPSEHDNRKGYYAGKELSLILGQDNPLSKWKDILQRYGDHYGARCYFDRYPERETEIVLVEFSQLDTLSDAWFDNNHAKRVLLASSEYRDKVEAIRDRFDAVVYRPITLDKCDTILQSSVQTEVPVEKEAKEVFEEQPSDISNTLNILVAEDNPINQKLIKIVLEKLGAEVTIVSNGQEAFEARIEKDYDMVFMDVQMPIMGGVEATHKILAYEERHEMKHIPIIALTANALSGDREKYMNEGMDDYATKPLDIKVIQQLIETYCNT